MAWTDACKIEACAQIDRRKDALGGAKPAMRILSEESGISIKTLQRWYWPSRSLNNEAIAKEQLEEKHETCTIEDLSALFDSQKRFGTIYADPPWRYSNQATRSATNNHYITMTSSDIAALPVGQLAAEKAHLHLWTTNAFLFDCPAILAAWGFEYKGVFVWVKPQMGIGNYWRVSHEFLVLGVKGGLTFKNHSQFSWIQANRTGHSIKPEAVAQIIQKVSPGPYLELFARKARQGWTVWGNEIEKDIFLNGVNVE